MKLIDTITLGNSGDVTNGIFNQINQQVSDIPFLTDNKYQLLDLDYYINNSGGKTTSQFFNRLYDSFKNDNEDVRLQKVTYYVAKVVISRYLDNWLKIYNAYFETDYKPLENYSMIENESSTSKDATSTSLTTNNNGESDSLVNAMTLNSGSSETPLSSQNTKNTQTLIGNKDSNYTDKTYDNTLTRSGNIGVTTSQQMLQSELDLRRYDFYQQVFKDVDSILCSYIYEF